MNIENRCELSTWAKTYVCSNPVTNAAPAVVARSRKNGMEIIPCFMSGGPFGGERQAMIEQETRGRSPGEASHALMSGRYHPRPQACIGIKRLHVLRNLPGIIGVAMQCGVAADFDQ